ncbi:trna ligase [Coemansia sp. RSA 2711]|nr:trna ligase [Coemansia sp. RSA 2711]
MTTRDIATKTWGPLTQKEQYDFRQLLTTMRGLSDTKPASKRIVRHTAHDLDGRDIVSWKCTEYLYKKNPCPLPTQARGLFTSADNGEERIVARGYNKFFNIGEVPQTKWSWIEKNTHGPYELTVKENGCLILAAGLDDGKTLLVTSKHAVHVAHAEVGRKWVERHLSRTGKTCEELAAFLYENNATAVFELCDDEFEEHILEYPERTRGLYLHGINRNAVDLDTWPSEQVTAVAERFGFHVTKCFEFDSVDEGRGFADKVRNDHVLDGRAIEGFVVRCQVNGSDRPFMFKIKYDEPYLMFREWREVTNRIVGEKPFRVTYPLTKHYVAWVKQQLKTNPEDFAEFKNQKGIIGARKRFLEFYKQHGGSEEDMYEQMSGVTKVLLVPVATIGCGKTTVSLALSELFGFGHVQNDNITAKKNGRAVFHRLILQAFDGHDFVIADRNNHLPILRQSLTSEIRSELVNCRIVALYWSHDDAPWRDILKRNVDRVLSRGESHQSLTPARTPDFKRVMKGFVTSFVPLNLESASDSLIEEIIELDPMVDSGANLRTAIDALCAMFPEALKRPAEEDIDRALRNALEFKPSVKKTVGGGKEKKPLFFGLVPSDVKVERWLKQTVANGSSADWDVCRQLLSVGDHDRTYHITLAHIASKKNPAAKSIYNEYATLFKDGSLANGLIAACTADYIVCNGSVMALRIKSMTVNSGNKRLPDGVVKQAGPGDVRSIVSVNTIPHITLCLAEGAKAVQANEMLEQVFGPDNASAPQNCPENWAVMPIELEFAASLEAFMN